MLNQVGVDDLALWNPSLPTVNNAGDCIFSSNYSYCVSLTANSKFKLTVFHLPNIFQATPCLSPCLYVMTQTLLKSRTAQ
jgi:hypothetical protein